MQDDPLVMPTDESLHRVEEATRRGARAARGSRASRSRCATTALWKERKPSVQLRDGRCSSSTARSPMSATCWVFRGRSGSCAWFLPSGNFVGARVSKRYGEAFGPEGVEAIEVEARRAEVLQPVRVVLPAEARGRVECDVVVDELAEIREPGRGRRVVLSPRGRLHHWPAAPKPIRRSSGGSKEEEAEEPSEAAFQEARPGNALQPAGQLRTVTRSDRCRGSALVDRHRLSPRRGPGTGSGSRSAARRSPWSSWAHPAD